jgi:hypothetical protein
MLQGERDPGAIVEHHLTGGPSWQCVADRHDRQALRQLRPPFIRRVERLHDETVHPLVPQLVGEQQLPFGVAGGVHEQRVVLTGQQRAADPDAEQLLPQVLQRAEEQPDRPGPAAGQGARDAVT